MLFALYPNDAQVVLDRIRGALSQDQFQFIQAAVEQAQALNEKTGVWLVVYSNDSTLASAKPELKQAQDQGFAPTLYLKSDWYVSTIGPFPTETDAQSAQIAIRTKLGHSSYVVNLNTWCPTPAQRADYWECSAQ